MEQDIQTLYESIDKLQSEIASLNNIITQLQNTKVTVDSTTDFDSKKAIVNFNREFFVPTRLTVTASQTVFPHSQYLILTAASAVTLGSTTSITDGYFPGQLLIIEGTSDTNTVTINDNTNTKMAGNITLGLNDTISFIWNGSDWVETSRVNS